MSSKISVLYSNTRTKKSVYDYAHDCTTNIINATLG